MLPTLLMVVGFLVALYFYVLVPSRTRVARAEEPGLYEFLLNKWYFDELYDFIFVRPAFWLGRLFWKGGDGAIIDRLGPDGVAARVIDVTGRVVKLQSGYIYHYAFAMLVGACRRHDMVRGRGNPLMFGFGILSCIVFLPLVGAGFILALRGDDEATLQNARCAALGTTSIVFLLSLYAYAKFDPSSSAFQFVEEKAWFGNGLVYKMGVDGISFPFVLLTTFLMPICILASWTSIQNRVKEYLVAFLVLETLMAGVFCALDIVLFYLFFEGGLIPMFLIIGIWGGKRRVYASFKFFLYTLAGSLLMLLAVMAMYGVAGTTDIIILLQTHLSFVHAEMAVARILRFTRRQASDVACPYLAPRRACRGADRGLRHPCRGSSQNGRLRLHPLLAADVSGSFGLFHAARVRVVDHCHHLYVARCLGAGGHEEAHRLFIRGAHGLRDDGPLQHDHAGRAGRRLSDDLAWSRSGALFLCVGVVYDRMHTRDIAAYGGLVARMPIYAVVFMIFTLANVGLPGTSGFIGEFLTLIGAFKVNSWVAFLATTGVILSAAYALYLYRRIVFGVLEKPSLAAIRDLSWREAALFAPLVALTILYGVYPAPVIDARRSR